jgi:endonuclease/exonuclease/phosphatase family metal-dependent hydrolase
MNEERGSRLVACAAFLAAFALAPAARGDGPLRLRVVTWNVWGVPAITTRLDERMAALPDALAALEPDIIVLQELWTKPHAELVTKRLAERGFRDARWFEAQGGSTGLFVASKLPLGAPSIRAFSLGRIPHSLWHLDWLVEKGVAGVVVRTPLGELGLEATHLQAQYRTDGYGPERLAQAVELVARAPERANEARILAGDFNGRSDELPRRAIRDLGRFDDALPASSEDTVYVRSGGDLGIRVVGARSALDAPVALSSGARERLSDHAAVVVELELSRCVACKAATRVTSATRAAALGSIERAAAVTPFRVALSLFTALALFVLGMGWKRRVGKITSGSRRRVAARLVALSALGAAFVWTAYLGAFYYPTRGSALRDVLGALSSMPER